MSTVNSTARSAVGSFVIGLVFLIAATVWGAVLYPHLPERIPVHWDAAGRPNGFADKTLWTVLGMPLLGILVAILLFAIAATVHRFPQRVGSTVPGAAEHSAAAGRMMGRLLVVLSVTFAVLSVLGWYPAVPSWVFALAVWLGVLAMLLVPTLFIVGLARAGALRRVPAAEGEGNTERYWRAGFFYVNRADPAVLVPKRLGVGWTVNFGSPVGIVIGVAVLALIAFVVLVAFTAG